MSIVTIYIADDERRVLDEWVATDGQSGESTDGPLTIESLAAMLLEDVALSVRRPGSWEGANMAQLLAAHGYHE
jgi:hypothetical protein